MSCIIHGDIELLYDIYCIHWLARNTLLFYFV